MPYQHVMVKKNTEFEIWGLISLWRVEVQHRKKDQMTGGTLKKQTSRRVSVDEVKKTVNSWDKLVWEFNRMLKILA